MIIKKASLDDLVDKIAPCRQLVVDYYSPQYIKHPNAAVDKSEGARWTATIFTVRTN